MSKFKPAMANGNLRGVGADMKETVKKLPKKVKK